MNWIEVTVNTQPERLDTLCADLAALDITDLVIEDEQSVIEYIENESAAWEHFEDDVLMPLRGKCCVKFYLEDSESGEAEFSRVISGLGGCDAHISKVRDEDWENNWRQYYKPVTSGDRLIIVPEWEQAPEYNGRIVLRLDPKQVFGNGTHASTRMCLEALEVFKARRVLDLGCGSGILSIASVLLGAEHVIACDIVPDAREIVTENMALNGIASDVIEIYTGDVLSDSRLLATLGKYKYDIVLANIVADVIIPLAPSVPELLESGGVFICSGIIDSREDEVRRSLEDDGFTIINALKSENWRAFACTYTGNMVK